MNATRSATGIAGSRKLSPGELAQASVMAALCAATAIISIVVPFAGALSLLGTVPMGLLAYRYRFRVLIAGTVAAGLIAFLIAGLGGLMTVGNSAYVGGLTGVIKRRGRGTGTVLVVSLVAGAVFNLFAVGALMLLSRLRTLIFDTVTANIDGVAAVLTAIGRFAIEHPFPLSTRIGNGFEATAPWAAVVHRPRAALLAVAALRQRGRLADDRVVDRLVGAVAGTGPDARHSRRAQAGRPARQRAGGSRPGAA